MVQATLLTTLTQQTEAQLQLAISEWQLFPESIFAQMPAAQSWSANQCVQHLNSYGRYYLPLLEKAFQTAKQKSITDNQTFKPGLLGGWFTRMMQTPPSGIPNKKMKSPPKHTPQGILPSHQVISEFIDQQERLLQLLQHAGSVDLHSAKVPISIATFIRLSVGDVLSFVVAHNQRHVQQAQRAIAEVRSR